MGTKHTIVVTRDTAGLAKLAQYRPTTEQDERDYYRATIECSDPASCDAWVECMEDGHVDPEEVDYEPTTMHGVYHEYIDGDWYVECSGCIAGMSDWDLPDGIDTTVDGTYPVRLEWDDWLNVELTEQESTIKTMRGESK